MASGAILGKCRRCGKQVWEDNWDLDIANNFVHPNCKGWREKGKNMEQVYFVGQCDVELNDVVRMNDGLITRITDIRTVQYLKSKKGEFEFEMAHAQGYWFKRTDFIYPHTGEIKRPRKEKTNGKG